MAVSRLGARLKRSKIATSIKSAYYDYTAAAHDTLADAKNRPVKASVYAGLFALGVYSWKKVPDQRSFECELVEITDKTVLLSDKVRNKSADRHIQTLSTYRAKGRLRYRSCGLFSLMYFSNFDMANKFYESQCKYVEPKWRNFHKHVIDVGFWGTWWLLRYHTTDYDVNFDEFPKELNSNKDIFLDAWRKVFGLSYFGNPAVPMSEQNRVVEVKVE